MREWLQLQEAAGNIIKFSLFDSKFCVGFQRSTYRGLKPHFFIYEILKRQVVRRFSPLLDQYKKEWWSDGFRQSGGNINIYDGGSGKKAGTSHNDSTSDADIASTDEGNADAFVEDVSVFELSPKGTYMVSYVSKDFLVLKMMPRALST
mmetsp:Transcript_6206/g.8295  ORF Transcript_6206/g.8295 Transcript_6206/m.8295 type:complete len:149 (-) Transcript_6206:2123-2569(-)|eukprot:CAMPEP_0185574178 /NCGR_PEP_ID=MMETSP0434-20130131/5714_1 /TAXON_ID=626734 ORGANISM="Favella taraikaensis, Strain Fe Narragansett Bay" /NCGR_SAMPLE_ID=MMETSP0434 /ASSEMBLY_ACC=CAM_ASM_000379 /LENGTH=148 /DNA_ID=CAMNT_0028190671 /DNA_START=126 /DNA_END=572 /DNA_ORIENTATION=+